MGLFDGYNFDPNQQQTGGLLGMLAPSLFGTGMSLPAQVPQGFPASAPPTDVSSVNRNGTTGVTLPQQGATDLGRGPGDTNPFTSLFSGIGNGISNLFSGGAGAPNGAAAPGGAQQQAGYPSSGPAAAGPGVLDRLTAGATNIMTGGNPIAGLFNSVRGLSTGQRTDAQGIQLQQQAATAQAFHQALLSSGVPPQQAAGLAQAAALNPEVAKTLAPMLYSKPTAEKLKDALGNERIVFANPDTRTVTEPGAGPSNQAGVLGAGAPSFLAPGVRQIDSSKTGDDYLKQFSPEVQAAVRNYLDGKSMPTGNPRQGYVQTIKQIAQKYGQDVGIQADDTMFAVRAQMRKNLSTAAPNSLGGRINIGNTAIGHLDDLSQKAIALGNWNFGGPDGSFAINAVRGHLSSDQAAKLDALKGAAQHYGQEITKFYAGSPGGEGERNRFLSAVDGAKTPQQLAEVISTEAELMHSRLGALGEQIRGTLGEQGARQYPVVRPESGKSLARISANVDRLRNGAGALQQLAPIDQQALTWANANPNDPRAAQIKQRLGVQ